MKQYLPSKQSKQCNQSVSSSSIRHRVQYIVDNFCKYFNEDLTGYTRFCIVISSSEESEVTRHETLSICGAMSQRIGLVSAGKGIPACCFTNQKPECHVHFVTDPGLCEDLRVRLVCSR